MTLQSSGTIRWSEIRDEFGANIGGTGVSLGRYRNSDSNFGNKNVGTLTDLPLDTGVPKSGTISASNFYSKRLNMVLDMYSGGTEFRVHCRTRYNDSSKVKVVGNYRSRPSNVGGTRVIVNINKTFGSEEGTHITTCAVKTGDWNPTTDLDIEIGTNGQEAYETLVEWVKTVPKTINELKKNGTEEDLKTYQMQIKMVLDKLKQIDQKLDND